MNTEEFQQIREKAFIEAQLKIANMAKEDIEGLVPLLDQHKPAVDQLLKFGDNKSLNEYASIQSLFVVLCLLLNEEFCSYSEARSLSCQSAQVLMDAIKKFDYTNSSHHIYKLLESYFSSYEITLHPEFNEEELSKHGDAAIALYRWADSIYTLLSVRFDDLMEDEELDDY